MKNFKSFLVMASVAVAALFASCSDEGRWEPYDTTSETTYSFEQKACNFVLTPVDTVEQVVVKVFRSNTNGNKTLPLNVTLNNDIMSFDTALVVFKNGESNAEFVINVDYANIAIGAKYTANIAFAVDSVNYFEHNASITGNSSTTVSIQVEYNWKPVGKAAYTEDMITAFFGAENLTYEVEVEQTVENPSVIRIKNAYGAAYPYNEPGDYDAKKDYYIIFNCEDPAGVYIDGWCDTGLNWGYGMFSVTSYGYYMMSKGYSFDDVKAAGLMGTIDENYVITFPVKGLVVTMPDAGTTYGNTNGAFRLDLSTTTIAE